MKTRNLFPLFTAPSSSSNTLEPSNISKIKCSTISSKTVKKKWDDNSTLSILMIGNSFSDDTMEYVAKIALSIGIGNVKLGNLYIGGCSLSTHYNNHNNGIGVYEYRINTGDGWKTQMNYHLKCALLENDWDFISLQQSSGNSGLSFSYDPFLNNLIEIIKEFCSSSKIIWNMTWAYQQNSDHVDFKNYGNSQGKMYQAIVDVVNEKIVPNKAFKYIIPNGTAIQNARSSFVGDNLTRDGFHLSYDLGRYIAGLTLVHTLTGLSIDDAYSPVSDSYKALAIEAAKNASLSPFEPIQSQYIHKATSN